MCYVVIGKNYKITTLKLNKNNSRNYFQHICIILLINFFSLVLIPISGLLFSHLCEKTRYLWFIIIIYLLASYFLIFLFDNLMIDRKLIFVILKKIHFTFITHVVFFPRFVSRIYSGIYYNMYRYKSGL